MTSLPRHIGRWRTEALLSKDGVILTEQTRWTNSGVNALSSDEEAAVSDEPLDEQLPRRLELPALALSDNTYSLHT